MVQQSSFIRNNKSKSAFSTILGAGLTAGILDGVAASIMFYIATGKSPVRVFQYIASAVFGREAAFAGGWGMAAWGLLFHFIIAFGFTIFFFLLYPRLALLSKNIVVTGLVYGIFIWLIMNLVIIPITNLPQPPFNWAGAIKGMIVLMLMVGLPIAIIIHKHFSRPNRSSPA